MASFKSSSQFLLSFNSCKEGMDVANLTSFSPEFVRAEYLYHPAEKVFITIITPMLSIFGVIGNGTFLFIVAKLPEMRTFTNAFLVNVAVCDILFLLTMMCNAISVYVYSSYISNRTRITQT